MSEDDQGEDGSLFDDPEFVSDVQELVDDQAPRLFAVVKETRDPEDAQIAAWGMTTKKGVEVFPVHGGTHMSLQSAENALIFFREGGRAVPHLVWVGGPDGE
ncbi:hypothetical protein AB0G02_04650 [Actinosynnema sp. NPDC023658]|uniref:hypothetical protein n=1 Tax=Actinosynnema sp. NPDC023658 TaxID=3155465 RepID=UPI0033DD38F5